MMVVLSRNSRLAAAAVLITGAAAFTAPAVVTAAPRPVDIGRSSSVVLATGDDGRGLHVINTLTGTSQLVSSNATASYGATLSPDASRIAYKSIDPATGAQSAVIYNCATQQPTVLATAPLVGTPSISASGSIAYTVGNELRIQNSAGDITATFDLGHHVNLVAISANGKQVAYNNESDQIIVLTLQSGARVQVTDGEGVYFAPQFSPNGKRVLYQSFTGEISVTSAKRARGTVLGTGSDPAWLNNNTVSFTTKSVLEGAEVTETALLAVTVGGKVKGVLASSSGDASAIARGPAIAFSPASQNTPRGFLEASAVDDGIAETTSDFQVGLTANGIAWTEPVAVKLDTPPVASNSFALAGSAEENAPSQQQAVVNGSTTVYLSNVPYIHQNNDTPDWWNGNWSCNATAAIMGMQYYNILPKHPMTVSYPSSHNSDYGWYIPNTYTFNGKTFNKPSTDPNGTTGYGGYGYITQNGWEDTKGHMAEYINFHGATSAVDWSPTIAEARSEIDANHPFVVLTSLTSAGHYPLCIGYVKNQHTLIFHDPYGNKNSGSYPSPDGKMVRYDWPGYNNGYSNMNTVHCYIWCRKTVVPPPPTVTIDNTSSGFSAATSWSTGTSAADKYGSNYRFRSTAAVSDAATWTFNVTQAGKYRFDTYYPAGSNRSATSPFIMPDGATVSVNQQTGGGAWKSLATKTLATGTQTVKLSCWTTAGFVVVADAVRMVPQF